MYNYKNQPVVNCDGSNGILLKKNVAAVVGHYSSRGLTYYHIISFMDITES